MEEYLNSQKTIDEGFVGRLFAIASTQREVKDIIDAHATKILTSAQVCAPAFLKAMLESRQFRVEG